MLIWVARWMTRRPKQLTVIATALSRHIQAPTILAFIYCIELLMGIELRGVDQQAALLANFHD